MSEADATEAEAYFRERDFGVRTHHTDGKWWADLVSLRSRFEAPMYGVGSTEIEAIVSAKRRWIVEQEPSPPLSRRLP
ncbi:MAG: hypothetical protein M3321_05360 [Actinomycetota bacterium]|nr:hypothetical protein [Actinomycetota bacterium]